ncbi:MAG: DUF1559 domain-containing protein [Gemmatales bacterium]
MHHSARLALTRAEVIVIILLLGVLMAMLVPGVVKVREAASFQICGNRLRAIALASHNYHNDYSRLPSGYYSAVKENGNNTRYAEERGPHVGVLVMLLPYLENDNLFKQLGNTAATWPKAKPELAGTSPLKIDMKTEYGPWWKEPRNLLANTGQMRIAAFQCPSDNLYDDTATIGIVSLQISNGTFAYVTVPGAEKLGRTNYVGVAGTAGDADAGYFDEVNQRIEKNTALAHYRNLIPDFIGCLYNRSTLTLGQLTVQDGTSNTVLFGESLGGMGIGPRRTVFTWFGTGSLGTAYGLGPSTEPGLDTILPPEIGELPTAGTGGACWFRFSSRHRERVNFVNADASLRSLRYGSTNVPVLPTRRSTELSDWAILQILAGRRDRINLDPVWIPD